ncbi:hypothetical protein OAF27_00360 [Verrucomicrobiales bacterium]|nr:hypothetical protein [Verrucomicrobiales bacterium]
MNLEFMGVVVITLWTAQKSSITNYEPPKRLSGQNIMEIFTDGKVINYEQVAVTAPSETVPEAYLVTLKLG